MSLMIVFLVCSVLVGMFMAFIWSSNGVANVLIKMVYSIYTLFAVVMLLGEVVPMVASSSARLF